MKILLLTDRLGTGGAETHIATLALELRRKNADVCVLSAGGRTSTLLERKGIRQIRLPLLTHNPFRLLILRHRIRRLIRAEKFDVLHAHARIPAFLIRNFRKYGCAEIVTAHARFKSSVFLRHICNWGEHTIAVSEDLRTYLQETYRIPPQRITVIPNGIDLQRFSPPTGRQEREAPSVLFASRLDSDCSLGAELLCSIAPSLARRFPRLHITIAGGGNRMADLKAVAEQTNRKLGFSCITLCGEVESMASLMRTHNVFVGVSRAALEAAACGCAVVLCGNEGYLGILNGETFPFASLSNFCCRGEPDASEESLKRDLTTLLESPQERYRCATECAEALKTHFDAQRTSDETFALYCRALRFPSAKTVTIGGYYGCGNMGDDAILQAFLSQIKHQAPGVRVLALTGKPREDRRRFGIPCYGRKNPLGIFLAFSRSTAFLCGGGSLLQNLTGKLSLFYYLALLRFARLCGATPILYAAGIGPIYGKRSRARTYRVLQRCVYIGVRDYESQQKVLVGGVDRARVHLGADPALLLPPPPLSRTHVLLHSLGVEPHQRYVCTVLRADSSNAEARQITVAALRMLCKRHGFFPLFICLDPHDQKANEQAVDRIGGALLLPCEPGDVLAVLRNADFLLTMRLHALIFATSVATPTIGIPCNDDSKIASFARLCGQECIPREELSVASLVAKCEQMYEHRDSLRPILLDAVADLQKKAQKDLENIVTMVYNINRYDKKSEDTT